MFNFNVLYFLVECKDHIYTKLCVELILSIIKKLQTFTSNKVPHDLAEFGLAKLMCCDLPSWVVVVTVDCCKLKSNAFSNM